MTRLPHLVRCAACLPAALLCACTATAPNWEASFGDASRQLRAQQLVDANAPRRNQGATPAADGRSTLEATDRYIDSYKKPPPTNVVNIGVGGGSSGGGAR